MSTSRSRLRTSGAFGNRKPKPIGFVPASAQPRPPVRSKFNIAHDRELGEKWSAYTVATKLIPADSMKPRVGEAAETERRNVIKGAANISKLMWNAAITGKRGEEEAFEAISNLKDPKTGAPVAPPAEEIRQLIADLVALKNQLFPDEKRVIMQHEYAFEDSVFRFRVNGAVLDPSAAQRPEGSVL
jgi:hypothetical protein